MPLSLLPAAKASLMLSSNASDGLTGLQLTANAGASLAVANVPGPAGRDPEYRVSGSMLQYRLINDVDWIDLVDLSTFFPALLWGGIGGTLGSQADLVAALAAKLDDSQAGAFGLTLLGSADVTAARASLDFTEAAQDAVGAAFDTTLVHNDAGSIMGRAAISGHVIIPEGSNNSALGTFTLAQLNAAVSDADLSPATHGHSGLLPAGGGAGYVIKKLSATDYDYGWGNLDKAAVGLGSVDNTADADKPISVATQAALDGKETVGAASAAVAAHQAAADPHPIYMTAADGAAAYASIGHGHAAASSGSDGFMSAADKAAFDLWKTVLFAGATGRSRKWSNTTASAQVVATAATGVALQANRLYITPLPLGIGGAYSKLSVILSTPGAAGAKIRVGIYKENETTGRPGELLVDFGEAAADGAAATLSFLAAYAPPKPGMYFLGVITNDSAIVLQSYDPAQLLPLGVSINGVSQVTWRAVAVDMAFGALPADVSATVLTGAYATGWTIITGTNAPRGFAYL